MLEKSRKATRIQTSKPKKKSKSQEEEERKKKADEDWNKQFGLKKGNQNEKCKRDNRGSSYSYKQRINQHIIRQIMKELQSIKHLSQRLKA